jgi:hypothetical protein
MTSALDNGPATLSGRVYRFRIRDNATGEVRAHVRPEYDEERSDDSETRREGLLFQWTEGNFGCDCNRELFFRDAGDEDYDAEAVECLPRGRYTVIDVTTPDGETWVVDA